MRAMLMPVPYTQHQSKGAVSSDPQKTALSEAYIWMLRICLLIMACLEDRYFHFLENETYLLMIFKTFVNSNHHGCW